MAQQLGFLHALTPLHPGTGQGVGPIDLPIARERATNLPIVPGTSIKGCMRDAWQGPHVEAIFGPDRKRDTETRKEEFAGALRISDAHLLLLPARCLGATFVWATCPFLLRRFQRDAAIAGATGFPTSIPDLATMQARSSSLDPLIKINNENRLVLEDLDFTCEEKDAEPWRKWIAERLYPDDNDPWREEMKKRFVIIDDKSFFYLSEFATEVTAHIAMGENGTVEGGALWYQEALPAESVLYLIFQSEKSRGGAILTAVQVMDEIRKPKSRTDIQFGGKATTGQGIARLVTGGGK